MDATIIAAPSSTKNASGERDPEMHQTKKGEQWYFGMKLHFGVDADSKVIHSIDVTSAEVYDGNCIAHLLHGEDQTVLRGDQLYAGRSDEIADHVPKAADLTNERVRQRDVEKPAPARNREKTRVRARVEHPFHTIKRVLGFDYTRVNGIAKKANRLYVTCAVASLDGCRHRLATWRGKRVPADGWQAQQAAQAAQKTLPDGRKTGNSVNNQRIARARTVLCGVSLARIMVQTFLEHRPCGAIEIRRSRCLSSNSRWEYACITEMRFLQRLLGVRG